MSKERQPQSIDNARAQALAAFRAEGADHRNCAQAVMLFALRACGGDPRSIEVARYLGGGMGRSGRTCGAVTGAALALGVRDAADPDTWTSRGAEGCAHLQTLITDFEAEFGHVDCAQLTGCDITTPEGYRAFAADKERKRRCEAMVDWVCGRLAGSL